MHRGEKGESGEEDDDDEYDDEIAFIYLSGFHPLISIASICQDCR
jgi:hypothetical protein